MATTERIFQIICLHKDRETLWSNKGLFEALLSGLRSEFE
jgi:hypothetical protein